MEKEKNILDNAAFKKNPFEVPANYFSDFSKNLEDKIAAMDKPKTVSFFTRMKPWMYVAASLLLFAGGIRWYVSGNSPDSQVEFAENETIEMTSEEAAMLLTYMDMEDLTCIDEDLILMDFLIEEESN